LKRLCPGADAHPLRPWHASTAAILSDRPHGREAKAQGWDTFKNGDLLTAAEAAGFDVLITTDKNIRYQQNLISRRIAIVVLGNAQWPVLRLHVAHVVAAVDAATSGSFTEVDIPVD
jgi:hypothetical protein